MIDTLLTVISAVLLLAGIFIMLIGTIGVFKFRYVLNRMHAAAMNDTLGLLFILLGLAIRNGLTLSSIKLLLVVAFLWLASPVCSHIVGKLEVDTNKNLEKECEIVHDRNH